MGPQDEEHGITTGLIPGQKGMVVVVIKELARRMLGNEE